MSHQNSSQKCLGIVVPHTHWDRAWYLPFQAYRLRLVEMLQQLLNWLETDALPLFVLDGQTVLLDDYFAVRPQDRPRVEALVRNGKLKIGPWYSMPDCFLARPESLIRNLQRGLQMADDLGGASRVGYVPDSFGHCAQIPQILTGFGIDSFLFMRGMPESLRDSSGPLFSWRAPSGHQVLATYLRDGYFPLGALGQDSFHGRYDGLNADLSLAEQRLLETLTHSSGSIVVLPAGGDHLPARNDLSPLIDELNRLENIQEKIHLKIGSFEDYLRHLRLSVNFSTAAITQDFNVQGTNADLPVYSGDLLGQADHPLLRNVLSSRIDLKILNHRAQSLLIGVVEPLLAWSQSAGLPCVDAAILQTTWDSLLKNHAHDDICGCSVDDVHFDDQQRFREIFSVSEEIINRQIEHIVQHRLTPLKNHRSTRVFAFNPHPWSVSVVRRVSVLLPDEGGEFSAPSSPRALRCVGMDGVEKPVRILSTRCKALRNRYLETTWGRSYDIELELVLPALGFEIMTVFESSAEGAIQKVVDLSALNTSGDASEGDSQALKPAELYSKSQNIPAVLLNGFCFELEADLGDGYSFGPCPEAGVFVSRLEEARVDPLSEDTFHLRFEIDGISYIKRDDLAQRPLSDCLGPRQTMSIAVVARRMLPQQTHGWELKVSYTNVFKDSRLRVIFNPQNAAQPQMLKKPLTLFSHGQAHWLPLPVKPADRDFWMGPLASPAYPGEKPYTVHHTNDGVVLGGETLSVYFGGAGVHEVEVVEPRGLKDHLAKNNDECPSIAMTLHRAVGFLSVRGGRIRSCQAGPQRPTPDAQMQQRIEHTLAFGCTTAPDEAVRALKEALHPCWIQECPVVPVIQCEHDQKKGVHQTSNTNTAGFFPRTEALSVSCADFGSTPLEILCLKPAHRSTEQALILRIVNPTCEPVQASIALRAFSPVVQWAIQTQMDETNDLPGTRQNVSRGVLELRVKPFEIQTWKLLKC